MLDALWYTPLTHTVRGRAESHNLSPDKRLKLTARVDCGMDLSSARRRLPVFRSAVLVGIGVSALAAPVRADEDGSFCIGPNYIAYELSLSVTPGQREHALYVVSLTDSGGIGRPSKIGLPRFQVHGLRCTGTSVELLGWDSLYTVPVGRTGAAPPAPVAQAAPWANQANRRLPQGFTSAGFWVW